MKTPVFAHSGRAADRRDRCRGTREAFTLIELLVVIAIIAILAAILLPVLEQAKVRGEAALSLSNTRQLTLGWLMYPDDNNGKFVSYTSWVFGTM
ncbi:MAG: prepilin-type N-terminal cleavage/methylation domain-containing protein, partial [Limisphaerales bacterium]